MRLTGYVVVELKTGKFQPEYAGKLNFYVALVDDVLRREHHNETIGILICGTKNDRSVRYSLGRSTSPMAVAAYTYDRLPVAVSTAIRNCPQVASISARWWPVELPSGGQLVCPHSG
ncbi:PDDEXK nuclease domain-containing protein [Pseudarthrobacter phenanthrenivorans]|uniref:PDDEXK nuclease domain-containing protein n=1 Tax=Pseudarthrobacter phenanthrenivorans TaxID=361575 RepID=UPI0035C77216